MNQQNQSLIGFGAALLIGAATVAAGAIVGSAIRRRTARQTCLQTMNVPLTAITAWRTNPSDEALCRQAQTLIDNWNDECGDELSRLPDLECG